MGLVDYSDSEDDGEEITTAASSADAPSLKRRNEQDGVSARCVKPKRPPPLPSGFHALYSTNARTSTNDDPTLHGGRQRQAPHVVGSWPSFVYLEWSPSEQVLTRLEKVIEETEKLRDASPAAANDTQLHSLLRSDLGVRLPLHVSLSSPLILTTDNKDKFEQDLAETIHEAAISSFRVVPSALRWVSNFDKTRYFLILAIAKPPKDELNTLLKTCNQVCRTFDLPELYAKGRSVGMIRATESCAAAPMPLENTDLGHDKFHISIAWALPRPDRGFEAVIEELECPAIEIVFDSLYVKIGNTVSMVAFRAAGGSE